ncbi:MAN2A2_10 [Blepharisma stoltei]|uniref:Glycoside hydrolase family 38 central domain-containing protein n=1 Tax=Blepharisma stoltei TaxID=1481888 RepID=A0AAU9K0R6_9CILI|nr:unnamed protein product [Blepharisma stoltei]
MIWLIFLPICFAIEFFIIPHSHCDLGWVETIEDYYKKQVRSIFQNIITLLSENHDRKFVWSETSFLKMFMDEAEADDKEVIKRFISEGRLEIVGGGFVQSDEANPDIEMVIRQIETGHNYLYENFGIEKVRVAWQIDPFGHSALTPAILANFGYEFLVINRVNYRYKEQLIEDGNLEFIWKGSEIGDNHMIFTHLLYDHYDYPSLFNINSNDYCNATKDLDTCSEELYDFAIDRKSAYKTDKIMLLYGEDFSYNEINKARGLFSYIENLRDYINASPKFKKLKFSLRIATPSEYFEAVQQSFNAFSYYKGDFFPYVTLKGGRPTYWTGFYTSRPNLKKLIFNTHKLTRSAEISKAFIEDKQYDSDQASLSLHHDIITGTCKDHVYADFKSRLDKEKSKAVSAINDALRIMLIDAGKNPDKIEFFKPYRTIIVHNPLNWNAKKLISLTSKFNYLEIYDWNLNAIKSQSVKNILDSNYTIYFKIELPALSYQTMFIIENSENCHYCSKGSSSNEQLKISDSFYTIKFNEYGMSDYIQYKDIKTDWKQQFWSYYGEASGAYAFQPKDSGEEVSDLKLSSFMISHGPIVSVAQFLYKRTKEIAGLNYYYQTVILYNEPKFIWKYGAYAYSNEEITVRFSSINIKDAAWLGTSNTGDLRLRKYISENRPSRKGMNMYPIPGGFMVKLENIYMAAFPKFTLGLGIVSNSAFELLLQRNLNNDDGFGLLQGLNDQELAEHVFDFEFGTLDHTEYWKSSLESKNDPIIFPIIDEKSLTISENKWYFGQELKEKWKYKTHYNIGINDQRFYLLSGVVKNENTVIRVWNFNKGSQSLNIKGVDVKERKLLGGFMDYKINEKLKTVKEIEFYRNEGNGMAQKLGGKYNDAWGTLMLGSMEIATFRIINNLSDIKEESNEGKQTPKIIGNDSTADKHSQKSKIKLVKLENAQENTETFKFLEYILISFLTFAALFFLYKYYKRQTNSKRNKYS